MEQDIHEKKYSELKESSTHKIQRELVGELDELNEALHKQNSPVQMFWGGIMRGLGTAIGATLLFGAIITVLSLIVKGSNNTWIQMIADWMNLDSYTS